MKFIFITLCIVALYTGAFAQDPNTTQNTLLKFDASISQSALDKLDPNEIKGSREEDLWKKVTRDLRQQVQDSYYHELVSLLKEKNIELQEVDALRDYGVLYMEHGYPSPLSNKGAIKKAIKNGFTTERFFIIDINAQPFFNPLTAGKAVRSFKTEVIVTIKIMDTKGQKIVDVKEKKKSAKAIKAKDFGGGKFNKLDRAMTRGLMGKMHNTIMEAIQAAVSRI